MLVCLLEKGKDVVCVCVCVRACAHVHQREHCAQGGDQRYVDREGGRKRARQTDGQRQKQKGKETDTQKETERETTKDRRRDRDKQKGRNRDPTPPLPTPPPCAGARGGLWVGCVCGRGCCAGVIWAYFCTSGCGTRRQIKGSLKVPGCERTGTGAGMERALPCIGECTCV